MIDTVDVRAKVRYVPISPQKVRLVIDLVRGMNVVEAMSALRFEQKAAAKPVYKLLRSAKPLLRRSSHISVILREREAEAV